MDKEEITIEELRDLKRDLEFSISDLIRNFEDKTSATIKKISFSRAHVRDQHWFYHVNAKIEIT